MTEVDVSIVIPVYTEEGILREAVTELEALFTAIHRQLRRGASGQAAEAILALARGTAR
jgi:hypothetical protein